MKARGTALAAGAMTVLWGAILASCLLPDPALASQPPAQGAPSLQVQERSLKLELSLRGSNGYTGFISTQGHKRVTLTLLKGYAAMVVRTTGSVSRHGIEAEFGDLGRISVRFEGNPTPWPEPIFGRDPDAPRHPCRGRKPVLEAGVFQGTVRFRGENDFTRIQAHAAPGTVTRHYRRVCEVDRGVGRFGEIFEDLLASLRVTLLRASAHADGATVTFEASSVDLGASFGLKIPPSYAFTASSVERRDGMRIVRRFSAEGDEKGAFAASGRKAKLQTATAVPPKPFAGRAKYLKRAGTPESWAGPLTVRLPGSGLTELTGPDFEAVLCHMRFKALLEGGCQPDPDRIAPLPPSSHTGFSSGQRLPVPGLLGGQALLVEVAAKLR